MGLLPMLSVQPVARQGTLLPTPYAIDVRIFCRAKKTSEDALFTPHARNDHAHSCQRGVAADDVGMGLVGAAPEIYLSLDRRRKHQFIIVLCSTLSNSKQTEFPTSLQEDRTKYKRIVNSSNNHEDFGSRTR
jgi:hypothetical protein